MHPQDLAEEFGDGYSNDYQRAFALNQMERTVKDDTAKANELVAQGKFVVLEYYPVYCKATDAVLGEDNCIAGVADSRLEALSLLLSTANAGESESRYEVLPKVLGHAAAPVVETDDFGNIPF